MKFALIKRHLMLYLRNRWAVFFSFLSVLIILGLFLLFLGNMFQGGPLGEHPDGEAFIYTWIFSGILFVSTVTVPLGFLGIMVRDFETKAINDFYVSPLDRRHIVVSYFVAAVVISLALSIVNLIVGQLYLWFKFGFVLAFANWLGIFGLLLLSSMLFSSIFFYVVTYVKTSNTHGTLSTLVGTLIGFLAGLYVSVGALPDFTRYILSLLPTLQMSSAFRLIYMDALIQSVFSGADPSVASRERMFLAIDLQLGDFTFSLWMLILIGIAWTLVFMTLSMLRLKSFKKT